VQETPEQVLARLVRYRDSLNRAPNGAAANGAAAISAPAPAPTNHAGPKPVPRNNTGSAPPAPSLRIRTPGPDARAAAWDAAQQAETATLPAPDREWNYSPDSKWRQTTSVVPATVFGQFLAVLACTLAVLAFEELDATLALRLVAAGAVVGLIAAARRVPLALWWTFGVILGGVLGRWS
jgi:hypothetical protein